MWAELCEAVREIGTEVGGLVLIGLGVLVVALATIDVLWAIGGLTGMTGRTVLLTCLPFPLLQVVASGFWINREAPHVQRLWAAFSSNRKVYWRTIEAVSQILILCALVETLALLSGLIEGFMLWAVLWVPIALLFVALSMTVSGRIAERKFDERRQAERRA